MSGKIPSTAALRLLREARIPFRIHRYAYQARGGAQRAAVALGVPLHQVIKTIVLESEQQRPLIVLMHGDRQISTKKLARALSVKRIAPCAPHIAQRATGYRVGGTSPLGTRLPLPVYVEESVTALETLYVNAGARGLLVELKSEALLSLLKPERVRVAIALTQPSSAADACR